jgi:hypothetical protein
MAASPPILANLQVPSFVVVVVIDDDDDYDEFVA